VIECLVGGLVVGESFGLDYEEKLKIIGIGERYD